MDLAASRRGERASWLVSITSMSSPMRLACSRSSSSMFMRSPNLKLHWDRAAASISVSSLALYEGANAAKLVAAEHGFFIHHRPDLDIQSIGIAKHLARGSDSEGPRLEYAHRRYAVAPVGYVPHELTDTALSSTQALG